MDILTHWQKKALYEVNPASFSFQLVLETPFPSSHVSSCLCTFALAVPLSGTPTHPAPHFLPGYLLLVILDLAQTSSPLGALLCAHSLAPRLA